MGQRYALNHPYPWLLPHHRPLSETKLSIGPRPPPVTDTWLRSGRNWARKSIHEAATIQVRSIADFECSPDTSSYTGGSQATDNPSSQTTDVASSQTTITEPPWSPAPANLSLSGSPTGPAPSQTETMASWTPQRMNSREINEIYAVPDWMKEVLDSDEYDSDTLVHLEPYRRPTTDAAPDPSTPRPSTPNRRSRSPSEENQVPGILPSQTPERASSQSLSLASSPGFSVVVAPPIRDVWAPEQWPANVTKLAKQMNPRNWCFGHVDIGVRDGRGCGCQVRCNALTCLNARRGRFCMVSNCAFAGVCGNAIQESESLMLSRNTRTGIRGVIAKSAIPGGEVIGEYLGQIQLFGPPCTNAPSNEGYRMHFNTRTTGKKYVGVDALNAGGMTRFLNHSCNAVDRFHEVHTGDVLTVVAVTVRDVFPGDEVTVDYGDSLWFLCRCGWWGCQHRHLQDLPDIVTATTA